MLLPLVLPLLLPLLLPRRHSVVARIGRRVRGFFLAVVSVLLFGPLLPAKRLPLELKRELVLEFQGIELGLLLQKHVPVVARIGRSTRSERRVRGFSFSFFFVVVLLFAPLRDFSFSFFFFVVLLFVPLSPAKRLSLDHAPRFPGLELGPLLRGRGKGVVILLWRFGFCFGRGVSVSRRENDMKSKTQILSLLTACTSPRFPRSSKELADEVAVAQEPSEPSLGGGRPLHMETLPVPAFRRRNQR